MKWMVFLGALLIAACTQSEPARTRGALSPAAPVTLTYRAEAAVADASQRIDITINTRLRSGALLVEVARQEGAVVIGAAAQRIDLAAAARPIPLQLQATLFGTGEHYLVLLLTVETDMGPMSRSFRIDLAPAGTATAP